MTKKIELKFWDVVIPWLSKSSRLQKMITKLADLYHNENFVKQVVLFVVIAFAGFACGFLIFSLSTIFA
jgi:hypothetical protein